MEKKKSILNIVDITIILVIVAIIVGSFLKSSQSRIFFGSHNTVKISYTVVISGAERELRQAINAGESVFLKDSGKNCGTISNIRKSPSKTYIVDDESDELLIKYDTSKLDITLTVTADAVKNHNGYLICDSIFIAKGKVLNMFTEFSLFEGTITNVSELAS